MMAKASSAGVQGREGRHAMILTWNPDKFHWDADDYSELVAQTARGEEVVGNWSTGGRTGGVSAGDRVFLLRQGTHGRGVDASGIVVSPINSEQDWDGSGGTANYADILWERVVPVENLLPTEVLKQKLPETNWDRLQMSGTFIRGPQVDDLEELWSKHISDAIGQGTASTGGQSILRDAERRKKIEDAAQERLMEYYRSEGWTVTDTRYGNPFDALATKGDETLYLEAKGTQSNGYTVRVTRGEVDHARLNQGNCVMGVWVGTRFDSFGEIDPEAGSLIILPFEPQEDQLIPVAYEWLVPYDAEA